MLYLVAYNPYMNVVGLLSEVDRSSLLLLLVYMDLRRLFHIKAKSSREISISKQAFRILL